MKKNFDWVGWVSEHRVPLLTTVLAALLAVPFLGLSNYVVRVFCMVFIYGMLTLSLNIVTGYLGATSMGHAALYCVGAYVGALFSTRLGLSFWWCLLLGIVFGAAFGTFLGVCTMRLSGSYMTVTTLAFAQVITMVTKNWESLTNGTLGVKGIPKPELFGLILTLKNGGLYYLALALLVLCVAFVALIMQSKFGRAFIAIRDDELSAKMMGLNTRGYRVLGCTLSGALASVAGCYYAAMIGYIDPVTFSFDISMTILTMVILGGLASIPGSLIGAGILVVFPELLRSLITYRFFFFGFILVIMMRLRPQGILGGVKSREYRLPKGVVSVKRGTRSAGEGKEGA